MIEYVEVFCRDCAKPMKVEQEVWELIKDTDVHFLCNACAGYSK